MFKSAIFHSRAWLIGLALSISPSVRAGEYAPLADVLAAKNPEAAVSFPTREPEWRISAGAIFRDIGDVRFNSGSNSQRLHLPSLVGNKFNRQPTAAGQVGVIGPREYQNGFVRTDDGTSGDGLTGNWGYQEAGQIQNDQLVFSLAQGSQRTVSRSSNFSDGAWHDDSDFEAGPYVEIERFFPVTRRLLIGPQANFSFINNESNNTSSTFAQHQRSETRSFLLTDSFNLEGIIPPLAPFAGSADGPGPLIDNNPTSRSISSSRSDSRSADFFNRVDESFDLDLFTIGTGVAIEYDQGPIFVQASAGVTLNIADWEATHRETLFVSRDGGKPEEFRSWTARESETDLLVGAYVQGKLGVQLTDRLSVAGFARYDWSQSLSGSVGPSSFDVDLDGLSAGVMVGFTF